MICFDTIISILAKQDNLHNMLQICCYVPQNILDDVVIPWTAIVKARGKKKPNANYHIIYCSWKFIRLLWPHDRMQLDMDFLLCLGRFFLSWTFSSIAQYGGADGQQPQKLEYGSIWKLTLNKIHSNSFQFSYRTYEHANFFLIK